nr:hypothetical protein [Nitrosomonas nitrosa]
MERGSEFTTAANGNHASRNPLQPIWSWLLRIFGGRRRSPNPKPQPITAAHDAIERTQAEGPAEGLATGTDERAGNDPLPDVHSAPEGGSTEAPEIICTTERTFDEPPPPPLVLSPEAHNSPHEDAQPDDAEFVSVLDRVDALNSAATLPFPPSAPPLGDPAKINAKRDHPQDGAADDVEPISLEQDNTEDAVSLPQSREQSTTAESDASALGPQAVEAHSEVSRAPSDTTEVRPPRRYRPRLAQPNRGVAELAAPTREPIQDAEKVNGASAVTSRDADFAISFGPGGWGVSLALLLRRGSDLPDQLNAQVGHDQVELFACGDDYYDSLPLPDAQAALADGIAATADGPPAVRWARGGRSLHVFTPHSSVAGFVTSSRIQIGVENVVVCTADLEAAVRAFAGESGAISISSAEGPGLPDGWVCLREIRPVSPQSTPPPSLALQPLVPTPNAVITFDGGIPISPTVWLHGRPPRIGLVGERCEAGQLLIDGVAAHEVSGAWQTPGWDAIGEHRVSFLSVSRSYRIAPPQVQHWPVTQPAEHVRGAMVATPFGNPVVALEGYDYVIGSRPGDIAMVKGGVASPPFAAVLAIATRVRRKLTRVAPILLGAPVAPQTLPAKFVRSDVRAWCSAIRGVHRDATGWSNDAGIRELWKLYVARAHQCWRAVR